MHLYRYFIAKFLPICHKIQNLVVYFPLILIMNMEQIEKVIDEDLEGKALVKEKKIENTNKLFIEI